MIVNDLPLSSGSEVTNSLSAVVAPSGVKSAGPLSQTITELNRETKQGAMPVCA
jgi:hypothetical protein